MKTTQIWQKASHTSRLTLASVLGASLLMLAACGTPGMVTLQNVGGGAVAPAAPTVVAQSAAAAPAPVEPTAAAPVAAAPTLQNAGNTAPAAAQPTQSGGAPATADDFVLIWVLFGTPTPHGAPPAQQPGNSNINPSTVGPTTAPAVAPTVAPTTAPAVAQAPTLPPTATKAGGSAAVAFAGDFKRGKSLFGGSAGCSACHDVTAGIVMVGPSLKGVASRAGTREPGKTAIDYLRESIRQPNAYVVKGFTAGVMVQNYGTSLTASQIDDIVAYLLTLK